MKLPILFAVVATMSFGAPSRARAGERKCGAHQHESVEKNEDAKAAPSNRASATKAGTPPAPRLRARKPRSRKRSPDPRQATLRRRGSTFARNCPV